MISAIPKSLWPSLSQSFIDNGCVNTLSLVYTFGNATVALVGDEMIKLEDVSIYLINAQPII